MDIDYHWIFNIIIIPVAIALWEFWNKKLWPYIQDSKVDDREHVQKLQEYATKAELLQSSWNDDKLAHLLEENESFVREQVWDVLQKILESTKTISDIKSVLMTFNKSIEGQKKEINILSKHNQELHERIMELIIFYKDKTT